MLNHDKPFVDKIIEINSENIGSIINGSNPVAIYFGTQTCEPCKQFSRVYFEASIQYDDEYPDIANTTIFAKVDGDLETKIKD